ncbi:MAG TPA: hypothetical protein VH186_17275 [Chloroflexia bacterium]|nr:hypothetical protein [Chloroflexia bacterium]
MLQAKTFQALVIVAVLVANLNLGANFSVGTGAAADSRYFPETGHTVSGKFLQYWQANGGLPTYGFPITDAQPEVDPETGKTFLTQWFERNRFELHPEFANTRYEVLLGLVGKDLRREALVVDPDFARTVPNIEPARSSQEQWYFPETGHNLRFGFLNYWIKNGGLERFGFPISEEHVELDPETGRYFSSQWFERARFEYHPENKPPYDILLGLLGNQIKTPRAKIDFVWKSGVNIDALYVPKGLVLDSSGNRYIIYNNQVHKFDSAGRQLLRWGSSGKGDGQFNGASFISIDRQNNLYVADTYNDRVQKFDSEGHFLARWGNQGNGEFWQPNGLALDAAGNFYVADTFNSRIKKLDPQGHTLALWVPNILNPYALAIDSQGNLYTGDKFGTIYRLNQSGQVITKWAIAKNYNGSWYPLYLVTDTQNNLIVADPRENHLLKFDGNGKLLAQWGNPGSGQDQLNYPTGLFIESSGNIYVADSNNNRVQVFDRQGIYLTSLTTPGQVRSQFNYPQGMRSDSQGYLYVSNWNDHNVKKFDGLGRVVLTVGGPGNGDGQFMTPGEVGIDSQGNIYVPDIGNNRIQKFDSAGHFLLKWGQYGQGQGQFDYPQSIAVDRQGFVYISDEFNQRIQKFDSAGHFLAGWGSQGEGDGQFKGPESILFGKDGYLYVADRGNRRIQKFDTGGHFIAKFGSALFAEYAGPGGIAQDQQGNIYASDTLGQRIEKFDSAGNFLLAWGVQGSGDYQFSYPKGLAFDQQGNLYVSDTYNDRIQKFRLR